VEPTGGLVADDLDSAALLERPLHRPLDDVLEPPDPTAAGRAGRRNVDGETAAALALAPRRGQPIGDDEGVDPAQPDGLEGGPQPVDRRATRRRRFQDVGDEALLGRPLHVPLDGEGPLEDLGLGREELGRDPPDELSPEVPGQDPLELGRRLLRTGEDEPLEGSAAFQVDELVGDPLEVPVDVGLVMTLVVRLRPAAWSCLPGTTS